MRYLGIETSFTTSSVVLSEAGEIIAEDIFASQLVLCDQLSPRIVALLGGNLELDGIAVSSGPGSFTGLRIGMITAKALGHVLHAHIVGVPTQHVMAAGCGANVTGVAVVQKARRGWVYAGLYNVVGGTVQEIAPVALVELSSVYEHIAGAHLAIGDGLAAAADADSRLSTIAVGDADRQTPLASIVLSLAKWPQEYDFDASASLKPQYMLASQAERIHGIHVD